MKSTLTPTTNPTSARQSALVVSLAATLSLGFASAAGAAAPAAPADASARMPAKAAKECTSDLRAFDSEMQKDGHWLRGAGYGYGYPMEGYNYDEMQPAAMGTLRTPADTGYSRARPGYEVRTLLASANILAQRGQQAACETLLGATRAVYTQYASSLRSGDAPRADVSRWRSEQLAAARPISSTTSYRSDQLIGSDVLSPQGDSLGSIEDLVMNPQSGKIAYLVICRGGFFGIDEKYVPVPWEDFKVTPSTNLVVLDTTKNAMEAAPRVKEDAFSAHGDFAAQSQKVDVYWKTQPAAK